MSSPDKEIRTLTRYEGPFFRSTVDSENLIEYLAFPHHSPVFARDFAPSLNLSFATPYLDELVRSSKEVFIFDKAQRQKLLDQVKGNATSPATKKMAQAFVNIKGAGERSRTIFYSRKDRQIEGTAVKYGKYKAVYDTGLLKVYRNEDVPLIAAHTHPIEQLFSPEDYRSLMFDVWSDRTRVVKGIIILCPKWQYLALATAETPLLPLDKLFQFESGWLSLPRLEYLTNRYLWLVDVTNQHFLDTVKREIEIIEMQSDPEKRDKLLAEIRLESNKCFNRLKHLNKRAYFSRETYYQHDFHAAHIAYSRKTRVKLYYSENMKEFYEFSA